MSNAHLLRRAFGGPAAGAGALALTVDSSRAQTPRVVATTYPGAWEEAHRSTIAALFKQKTGAEVDVASTQGIDQVARIVASPANPPHDVVLFPTGPMLQALPQDILAPFPGAKSANYNDVPAVFRRQMGPDVALQIVGIAYNQQKIRNRSRPPRVRARFGLHGPDGPARDRLWPRAADAVQ